jgi:hypothetical protein
LNNIETGLAFKSYIYNTPAFGLMALPVIWFLFSIGTVKRVIGKQREPVLLLTIVMVCLGFLQIATIMLLGSVVNRYSVDFFWLFVFSGLLCTYFIYERIIQTQRKIPLNLCKMTCRVINAIMIISNLLSFLVTFGGDGEGGALIWNNNPAIYYSIQRLLGFNTW